MPSSTANNGASTERSNRWVVIGWRASSSPSALKRFDQLSVMPITCRASSNFNARLPVWRKRKVRCAASPWSDLRSAQARVLAHTIRTPVAAAVTASVPSWELAT